MTTVTVRYKDNRVVSLEASGHAKFKPRGSDIVCAAVSALMQTAVNSLEVVAGIQPIFEADAKSADMYVELPRDLNEDQASKAEIIFQTVITGLQGIADGYPKNMKLLKEGGANIQ
jgi:uncharacterized protein YsxB (DUF464 family)